MRKKLTRQHEKLTRNNIKKGGIHTMKSKIVFPALVLAFLLSLVAVALPQAALAEGSPWVYLNPESGPSGRMVTVTGWGFTPDAEVGVYFDEGLVDYRQANCAGNFTAYFYVP